MHRKTPRHLFVLFIVLFSFETFNLTFHTKNFSFTSSFLHREFTFLSFIFSFFWPFPSLRRHPRAVLWPDEAVWSRRLTSIHALPFPGGLRWQRVFQYWSESVYLFLSSPGPNQVWHTPCVRLKLCLLIAFSQRRSNQAADIVVVIGFCNNFKCGLESKCRSEAWSYI